MRNVVKVAPMIEWGVAAAPLAGETESGDLHLVKPVGRGMLVAAVDGLGHGAEAVIILRFLLDDEAAQKQDRNFQQAIHDQLKNDQDASGAAVAVEEGVNGFELVVCNADTNKRVDLRRQVVAEKLKVCHFLANQTFAIRWRVNDFLRVGVLKLGSGQIADTGAVFLDDVHNLDREICREERPGAECVHSVPKRVAIMEDFLRVRRKVGAIAVRCQAAIQLVVGRENVLDFGAEFRFLKRESVEQDLRIRNGVGATF